MPRKHMILWSTDQGRSWSPVGGTLKSFIAFRLSPPVNSCVANSSVSIINLVICLSEKTGDASTIYFCHLAPKSFLIRWNRRITSTNVSFQRRGLPLHIPYLVSLRFSTAQNYSGSGNFAVKSVEYKTHWIPLQLSFSAVLPLISCLVT